MMSDQRIGVREAMDYFVFSYTKKKEHLYKGKVYFEIKEPRGTCHVGLS